MNKNDLDSTFDATPAMFTNRIDETLSSLNEEAEREKFSGKPALIPLLSLVLLLGTACAVAAIQGQKWYYSNRFTAYQENEPSKQQAIMSHLATVVPLEPGIDTQGLTEVTVQDYSWAPEQNLLTISLKARVKDTEKYEIHAMTEMDPDGYWASATVPSFPEIRTEHWLQTKKGFGLPRDVMENPEKKLLLFALDQSMVLAGSSSATLLPWVTDSFTSDDGSVITVLEFDLGQNNIPIIQGHDPMVTPSNLLYLNVGDSGDDVRKLQKALAEKGYYYGTPDGLFGESVRLAVKAFQKANKLWDDGVAGPDTLSILYASNIETNKAQSKAKDNPTNIPTVNVDMSGDTGASIYDLIDRIADDQGMLTLRISYQITSFEKGNFGMPVNGVAVFKAKVR